MYPKLFFSRFGKFQNWTKFTSFILFFLLPIIHCATVDVSSLNETEIDREALKNFSDLKSIKLTKVGVTVKSQTQINLAGEYGTSFQQATTNLIQSLGGVEVIGATKTRDEEVKEQIKKTKGKIAKAAIDQKLGEDDKVKFEKIETKFSAWFEINANLTGATSQTQYFPPREITVKDENGNEKTEMSAPSWKTTVTAYVFFKVIQTNPGQPRQVVLIRNISNSFNKSFSYEPKKEEVIKMYPEAILYCYEDIKEELQELFPVKTYLTAMREEKGFGQIKGGKDLGLEKDRVFDVYEKEVMDTLIGKKEVLNRIGSLKLFEVRENESWGKLSGPLLFGFGGKDDIKLGMDMVIVPQRRTIFDKAWRMAKSYLGVKGFNFLEEAK